MTKKQTAEVGRSPFDALTAPVARVKLHTGQLVDAAQLGRMDPLRYNEDKAECGALIGYYAQVRGEARVRLHQAKIRVDAAWAHALLAQRRADIKRTVEEQKSMATLDPAYIKALDGQVAAEQNYEDACAVVDALVAKKDMINAHGADLRVESKVVGD